MVDHVRACLLAIAIAGCSRGSSAPAPIASLIVPDATALVVARPTDFPLITMLDGLPDMYRCWRTLETKLEATYQVFVPNGGSYVILVGDLPRAEVERCAMQMLLYNNLYDPSQGPPDWDEERLPRDGALTFAPTTTGVVYAAWRDNRILAGRRADVERALGSHAGAPAWLRADELSTASASPNTAFVGISTDAAFANVVGVPTQRWKLVMETAPQPWPERRLLEEGQELEEFGRQEALKAERKKQGLPPEEPAPPPRPPRPFTGRLELSYATAADAARAAETVAKNAFAIPLEPALGAAISKLLQTVTGTTLTLRFDQDSFPGVELEKLQAWVASLQAAAAH